MKKALIFISLLFLAIAFILSGCKKDKDEDTTEVQDTDTQTAQDNSLAEGTFNDVTNIANQAVENGSLTSYRKVYDEANLLSGCATVTIHDTSGHGTIEVFFGSAPCLCNDFRYRKGTVNLRYSGMYGDSGTVINVSFTDYYVGRDTANMYKVAGTKTIVNLGHNALGHEVFSIDVNGSLLNASGQTMTWISQRTREWIAGETTLAWSDDEYMIRGSVSGTGFNGTSFTLTITQALHIALNCRWIKDGKFELIPSGKLTRYVDYGGGTCDAIASVQIGPLSFNVTLP